MSTVTQLPTSQSDVNPNKKNRGAGAEHTGQGIPPQGCGPDLSRGSNGRNAILLCTFPIVPERVLIQIWHLRVLLSGNFGVIQCAEGTEMSNNLALFPPLASRWKRQTNLVLFARFPQEKSFKKCTNEIVSQLQKYSTTMGGSNWEQLLKGKLCQEEYRGGE